MTQKAALIMILLAGLLADGRTDGRRGNEAYVEGDFQAAAEAYQKGLSSAAEDGDQRLLFGLSNNLGATQYRMENPEQALEIFESAALGAPDASSRAVASYNAGNAAFKAQDLQRAVDHYRRALLENPNDLNAKYNFEFASRRLQEQSQNQQQQQQQQDQQQQEQEQGGDESQSNQGEQDENQQDEQSGEQEQQQDQQQAEGEQDQQGESPPDEGEPTEDPPEQEGSPQPSPTDLSREQAERILQALENEEAELLREVQRMDTPPRRVEKDW